MYFFTHSTPLNPGDVWRMTLNAPEINVDIGFTTNHKLPDIEDSYKPSNRNAMAQDASYIKFSDYNSDKDSEIIINNNIVGYTKFHEEVNKIHEKNINDEDFNPILIEICRELGTNILKMRANESDNWTYTIQMDSGEMYPFFGN